MDLNFSREIVASRSTSYRIVADALGGEALSHVIGRRPCLVVSSPTVQDLYVHDVLRGLEKKGCDVRTMTVEVREHDKTMERVEAVCAEAVRHGIGRGGILIGVGGGVLTDVVTMAASLIRRGIGYVRVPTTLVGLVDAGIGAKGAVNAFGKKSVLGCFHAPEAVVLDPSVLQTLPRPHLRYGLSEMVKIALVKDRRAFELVEAHGSDLLDGRLTDNVVSLIWLAANLLLDELEPNLYETETLRRPADFGHTFSPEVETASAFSIHHGDAVAIDMALSTSIAGQLGLLSEADAERVYDLIGRLELPLSSHHLTVERCEMAVQEATRHRGGELNLVVPTGIGESTFLQQEDIRMGLLEESMEDVRKRSSFSPVS